MFVKMVISVAVFNAIIMLSLFSNLSIRASRRATMSGFVTGRLLKSTISDAMASAAFLFKPAASKRLDIVMAFAVMGGL